MNIVLSKENSKDTNMMRDVYCKTLIRLAKKNNNIVALDSDLMNSMGMIPFLKEFPERTFNCGIQEANMIGIAAGMSATGKIPFAHSFGTFASRRCFDQVFMSTAYARLNVRIIGSDPGITAAFNGGTHMPLEDMGIMRNIPTMTVIEPTDCTMLENIIEQLVDLYGVFYVRLLRKYPITIYKQGSSFDIGKAAKLLDGRDATIFCSGIMVDTSLKAAELLKEQNISVSVQNMFTIKPIDKEAIIEAASKTGAIVTAENHNIVNGLGSAVAEVLSENIPTPLERVGIQDHFGEAGPEDYLREKFKLTPQDIVQKVKKVVTRKKLNK